MKDDNHPLFSDSTLVSVHDSKTFECNNSVFDTAEGKPTMKGNQNGILSHSNGYKQEDSLGFPINDFGNSNVHENREDPLACNRKEGNEFWKVPELDDSIFLGNDNEMKASSVRDDHNVDLFKINGDSRGGNPFACDIPSSETNEIVAASVTDDQNGGLTNIIHSKRSRNPFECDTKDRDQPWNIPEYDCSMIVDFLDDKENETIDSASPFTSHSELFEHKKYFYSDKGVTDHELPELTVCYRENNYNMVKDICMDEGVPAVDKVLIESWKDDQPSMSVSVNADEEKLSTTRKSIDMESTLASVSQDSSFEDAKNIAVTHDTEKDATGALVSNGFKPSLEINANKDIDKDSYLEDLMMMFGSKCTTNGKATNASEKPSSPNTIVRGEESNINGKATNPSDSNQSTLQPDQVPFEQSLKSQTAISAADETNNKDPASNLFHNRQEEAGTSILDFNLTKPESTKIVEGGGVKNLPVDSHMPKAVSVHKDGNSDNLSASSQVHFASTTDNAEPHHFESQNVVYGQGHFDDGEASFSTARGPVSGSITYSGHISYSGSVSLRSESSTTSTISFAFPVLQNEWNSSPVRMAKADRRRLSKHKGWKQGLLCCRF